MLIGYTYTISSDPDYAFFLYTCITSMRLYVCRCYKKTWDVVTIDGTKTS